MLGTMSPGCSGSGVAAGSPNPVSSPGAATRADLDDLLLATGQDGVEQDKVGLDLLGEIESLHASVGREHLESVVGQLLFQVGPHRALVLNQENRPPEHGGEASNGVVERLDVL
jgi:hypothetical protein